MLWVFKRVSQKPIDIVGEGSENSQPISYQKSQQTTVEKSYAAIVFERRAMGASQSLGASSQTQWTTSEQDPKAVINAIFYIVVTGCDWQLLSQGFSKRKTVYR